MQKKSPYIPTKAEREKFVAQNRKETLLDLFPSINPYSSGFLELDDTHKMYWEQSGNPDGVPVVLFHGGPGAGATATHRRFFDPDFYRIIIFDQRGAGRSLPLGNLENNTIQHLIQDIEKLRLHLSIDRWHIFGGSWGSTLAMTYASEFPAHVISLTLRGIFLCEQYEIDWFLYGMRNVFPEAWEQFTDIIPEEERNDLLNAYYRRLTSEDEKISIDAGITWSLYEGACSSIVPNYEIITTNEQKEHALSMAKIEAHYFKNEARSEENSLLTKIDTFREIPTTIIQGRYDIICPIRTAYKLHQLWPEAEYVSVPDAGHSALDPQMRTRLIEAMEHMKTVR